MLYVVASLILLFSVELSDGRVSRRGISAGPQDQVVTPADNVSRLGGLPFGLIDCNNFYVSCERVCQSKIRRRPVVVLSNNDGCVIARSNEAKALGVKMGTPLFKAQHLVKEYNVAVFSSNYALYGDMSHRVVEALQEFTPEVEVYSIDEAFMRLDDEDAQSFHARGVNIKEKVLQWLASRSQWASGRRSHWPRSPIIFLSRATGLSRRARLDAY